MTLVTAAPRVLVIEDDAPSLGLMVFLLQAFGCETFTSVDGEGGLVIAHQDHPDLIICDIQLPLASGYDVVRELKSRMDLRAIPVVAVTAYAMVGDRERAMSAGFDGYVPKPIEPETFMRQVQAFLKRKLSPPATIETPPNPQEDQPKAQDKGVTVLVVDDTPAGVHYMRSVLEPYGYAVRVASGVREALALARKDPPHLILSDVHMGDGTGYDLVEVLEKDAALSSIPVILISATRQGDVPAVWTAGGRAGCAARISGPLEPEALLEAVRSCLEGASVDERIEPPEGGT